MSGGQQLSLAFGASSELAGMERVWLDGRSWVDWLPAWVAGADALFRQIAGTQAWSQRTRWMYERRVLEPRLTSYWSLGSGDPVLPPVVERLRMALSAHYGVVLDSVGFNLYRGGNDSVAWHRDKIDRRIGEPVVALVSLGARRRFLLRPRGGGRSRAYDLGRGDLLVTGGRTQRDWEHCVPKVAHAEPRISLAFRHGMDSRAYGAPAP